MNNCHTDDLVLDKEYSSLTLKEKNSYLLNILSGLLQSADLDLPTQCRELLSSFSDYDWQAKEGVNAYDFSMLMAKGENGTMTHKELNTFMCMVSERGQYHLYFLMHKGNTSLNDALFTH